jgi:solute carrier family 25 (peroxisomal adenine nucleotide transporter), member 17
VYNEEGVKGFYKGIVPSLILVSNPAVQFMVFERLKTAYLNKGNRKRLVREERGEGARRRSEEEERGEGASVSEEDQRAGIEFLTLILFYLFKFKI